MTQKMDLGREGEEFAAAYLKRRGYWIIQQNWRRPFGELDIIATAPDKTLVFMEVKTVKDPGDSDISAEEHMTAEKRRRFERAASVYAESHPELVDDKKGWRLDVVALTANGNDFILKHYENI